MSRRERMREHTREEIKTLARRQMAASGTASLSLNAIARAMEMVPSALYRYYPDRDALITALIADAYNALADALDAADAAHPAEAFGRRLLAAATTYRAWALDHPVDFQLIFGNPIPGYQAPAEITGPASARVFGVFLGIIQAAHEAGMLRRWPAYRPEALAACEPGTWPNAFAPDVMYAGVAGWTKMHGMIMLELFGHLQGSIADTAAFYQGEMCNYTQLLGIEAASAS